MNDRRTPGEVVGLAAEAASVWVDHNLIRPFRPAPGLPRAMHYISTHRCNARCVMCGIWKETGSRDQDLSPADLDLILTDRLFSKMEFVGISGGEPFVRDDLSDLCRTILERCGTIRRISLTTNGLLSRRIADALPAIADATRAANALLDVSVSAHGMGESLDAVYGVEGAFAKILRTVELLVDLSDQRRLSFSMNCVLLADNLAQARELGSWAAERGVPLSFVVGERRPRFRTEGLEGAFASGEDLNEIVGFLRELSDDPAQSAVSADKYREIADILDGRRTRSLSCYYAMGGVLLGHDGTLFYCSHSKAIGNGVDRAPEKVFFDPDNLAYRREALLGAECRHCPPYTRTRWEIEKDLVRTLAFSVRRRFARLSGGR